MKPTYPFAAFAQSGAPVRAANSGNIQLPAAAPIEEIRVTSRRREELAQNVPIPVTVVSGALVADTGGFNVNRIKELIPSVQQYSSNPRNTAISIRGRCGIRSRARSTITATGVPATISVGCR